MMKDGWMDGWLAFVLALFVCLLVCICIERAGIQSMTGRTNERTHVRDIDGWMDGWGGHGMECGTRLELEGGGWHNETKPFLSC